MCEVPSLARHTMNDIIRNGNIPTKWKMAKIIRTRKTRKPKQGYIDAQLHTERLVS